MLPFALSSLLAVAGLRKAMSPADTVAAGGAGAGFDEAPGALEVLPTASLTGFVSVGADLKMIPRNINTVTATAQSKMTKAIPATGESFGGRAGAGGIPKFVSGFAAGRRVAFEPFIINSSSSPAGACGTMILWKHDGHSIIELHRHDSHLMLLPQDGQTNLNSLILLEIAFHIRARLATGFLKNFFLRLCD
jgi:hypothetical protein